MANERGVDVVAVCGRRGVRISPRLVYILYPHESAGAGEESSSLRGRRSSKHGFCVGIGYDCTMEMAGDRTCYVAYVALAFFILWMEGTNYQASRRSLPASVGCDFVIAEQNHRTEPPKGAAQRFLLVFVGSVNCEPPSQPATGSSLSTIKIHVHRKILILSPIGFRFAELIHRRRGARLLLPLAHRWPANPHVADVLPSPPSVDGDERDTLYFVRRFPMHALDTTGLDAREGVCTTRDAASRTAAIVESPLNPPDPLSASRPRRCDPSMIAF